MEMVRPATCAPPTAPSAVAQARCDACCVVKAVPWTLALTPALFAAIQISPTELRVVTVPKMTQHALS